MKKFLALFILVLGLVGCANEDKLAETPPTLAPKMVKQEQKLNLVEKIKSTPQFDTISFDILVPNGSVAMGLTHLAATRPELGDHVTYTIQYYVEGSETLQSAFTSGTSQVIVAPTNLGATFYQKGIPYQLVATLAWGDLYLISGEELAVDELAGRKITTFGQGSTSDIVLQMILKEKGLRNSVEIEYLSSISDVQSRFAAGDIDVAVIAKPFLSFLKTNVENVNIVVDFQEQWGELYGMRSYPQTSLFVHKDLIQNHPEVIEPLLAQVETSIEFANQSPAEMAKEAIQIGLEIEEPIMITSVPSAHLMFKTAEEAKEEIEPYLQQLYEFDPRTVGGALPGDDFYYLVK